MNNQPKVLEYILSTVKTFKNDVQNKLGRTALNIAASQGAFECVNILLSNLDCDINSTDKVSTVMMYPTNNIQCFVYNIFHCINNTKLIKYYKICLDITFRTKNK